MERGTIVEKESRGPLRASGLREPLDEREFIRERLHGGRQSAMRRYAGLVLARPTWLGLLKYELINFFGGIPGALGLVLRRSLYRGLLGTAGKGVTFGRSITLRHAENIHLGDQVFLDDYCLLDARGAGASGLRIGHGTMVHRNASIQAKVGHISIGENCSIGALSQIVSQGSLEIGDNVSIAGGVGIAGGRYQVEFDEDGPDAKKRYTAGPIRIHANVRVGRGAIILDGVTIGRGAIVAPGSVVMNDVAENTVVMGSPARPLRQRERKQAAGDDFQVDDEAVKAVIRRYIEETHFAQFGSGELSDNDSLFDHGVMDSAGAVALVTMLESEFQIKFEETDLDAEKMSNVNGLASLTLAKIQADGNGSRNSPS
jgi:acetyltransferase-like isoleucine patch superfamily enzyme/acyl carrier protein